MICFVELWEENISTGIIRASMDEKLVVQSITDGQDLKLDQISHILSSRDFMILCGS